ncbi:emopamil binding protein [Colletotrichum graminicola]|uniref:Emopamil binding protein n=1 Tax=Colletotrichum graminicola (strain M1.001 / M2 / FGSC 10212) TaxID=645133 RepID=E3QSV2_COLGM|nr:emopamil binding protein [Colletotrichum graminicola M1.001]EFQ33940.1 emopamil binding protein [Colletotrichum graminicola M1.001]WDK21132.1 emopamil binding protein [Colletotrichum graminicola]
MAAKIMMNASIPIHPYSPGGAMLPGYVANTLSANELRAIFAVGAAVILGSTYRIVKKTRPDLPGGEMATTLWFTLSAFIHFFFEGYFSYNQADMPTSLHIFGQLWKEYSLSDSRYLTQDSFIVCMETITAVFWGPLSFACACCIVAGHPLRHPLQLVVSLGQLYGDVLYFATCSFDELVYSVIYCRPEDFYYWWYYVFCNAFWIVIPFCLILKSCAETKRAFEKVAAMEKASHSKKNA